MNNQSNKLEDYDKALELAGQIEMIKSVAITIDWEYLKEVAARFIIQASFEDSAAVLNLNYSPTKSTLLMQQADGLNHLASFVESLKKCQELKDKIASENSQRSEIMKMFW